MNNFLAGKLELDDPQPVHGTFFVYEATKKYPKPAAFVYDPLMTTIRIKWMSDEWEELEIKLDSYGEEPFYTDEIEIAIKKWFEGF